MAAVTGDAVRGFKHASDQAKAKARTVQTLLVVSFTGSGAEAGGGGEGKVQLGCVSKALHPSAGQLCSPALSSSESHAPSPAIWQQARCGNKLDGACLLPSKAGR